MTQRFPADGRTLYFSSDYQGSPQVNDIYVVTRASTSDEWGVPEILPEHISAPNCHESMMTITADERTSFFIVARFFGDDHTIYASTRLKKTDPWGAAVAVGSPIEPAR